MKKLFALVTTAAVILTGCVTNQQGQRVIDPDKVSKIAPALQSLVAGAVIYGYSKDTNTVAYAGVVRAAVNEFIIAGNLDPLVLQQKINELPLPALKTPQAQLIIVPVLVGYKAYAEELVRNNVDPNQGLKILASSLVQGIDAGLSSVQSSSK